MPSRRFNKSSWFPASIILGLLLCWYMLYLIQNTPGRDINLEHIKDPPAVFDGKPDLRIVVLAYNRPRSLKRLLESLTAVYYLGDKVALEIFIDRSSDGKVDSQTVKEARAFKFKYGEKFVYVHGEHKGVLKQWTGSWDYRTYPNEICVFLEDSVVVSQYFYRWLKSVHKMYGGDNRISGFNLQGALPIRSYNKINVPKTDTTFLYRAPGTWGFSPNVEQWSGFISWLEKKSKDTDFDPKIDNDIVGTWYKENSKLGTLKKLWSMWFFYYNWQYNKFVLYPNIQPDFQGFCISKKEPGANRYGQEGKPVPGTLLVNWSPKYEKLADNPPVVAINGSIIYPHVQIYSN